MPKKRNKNSGSRPLFLLSILPMLVVTWGVEFILENFAAGIEVIKKYGGAHCLPESVRWKDHDDYYFGFLQHIPRRATCFCGVPPPTQRGGNQDYWGVDDEGRSYPMPIPRPGEFQHSVVEIKDMNTVLHYYAINLPRSWLLPHGLHLRIGWRYDNIDGFYTWSISRKTIEPHWECLLFNRFDS